MTSFSAIIACDDLDAAMTAYEALGFRLDMIMPADAPRVAVMSAPGMQIRVEAQGSSDAGRAGMLYRDLVPDRLGGRVIASHIRIPGGGPVPDYVHYHRVGFQMIYCAKGWVRVVYEDQGPPFVMREGDCVLQPPGIRHRVLEASQGLEVIEVSAPAEHETFRDHALTLPTPGHSPDRDFGGQRFVRHVAADVGLAGDGGFDVRDTGISNCSGDAGSVRVLSARQAASMEIVVGPGSVGLIIALSGSVRVGDRFLEPVNAAVISAGTVGQVQGRDCAFLEVVVALV